ncbi:LytTR family DNA-binding domain-containing protein [Qipengyuania sp.]|uniref:LytTR family DNA-binding domain-containing protein n=1 Tax=Qipengyuania sp. TaxID=2004515 RepID=UPI0035C7AA6E
MSPVRGDDTVRPKAAKLIYRLRTAIGSDLIALEMEDHYVRAHTVLGSELVLMRMRDAVAELDSLEGEQVHRSWWVARDSVTGVKRDGRNVRLQLEGGLEAPVARARLAELKQAGWL